MSKSLFTPAPTELTENWTFLTVYGDTGSGRTTFALSAPGPIAFFNASEKIEGIVQPFARDKQIHIHDFSAEIVASDPKAIATQANKVWTKFKLAIEEALEMPVRTIVIDTATEAWELIRWARFGKLTQVMPHHYAPVNAEWITLMKKIKNAPGVNLIATAMMGERYLNDKPTGVRIPKGMNRMEYLSDVVLRMERDGGDFSAVVEKAWWNVEMLEEEVPPPGFELSFPEVMALITEMDVEAWSA